MRVILITDVESPVFETLLYDSVNDKASTLLERMVKNSKRQIELTHFKQLSERKLLSVSMIYMLLPDAYQCRILNYQQISIFETPIEFRLLKLWLLQRWKAREINSSAKGCFCRSISTQIMGLYSPGEFKIATTEVNSESLFSSVPCWLLIITRTCISRSFCLGTEKFLAVRLQWLSTPAHQRLENGRTMVLARQSQW